MENNRIKYFKHLWSCSWEDDEFPSNLSTDILKFCQNDTRNVNNKYFCEIYDKKLFHIRAGSGWMNEDKGVHLKLAQDLHNILCK